MLARQISYTAFRNLHQQTLQLDSGINILCGENAQGKTNALEGLYLFAAPHSFRPAREREMICFEQPQAKLQLEYQTQRQPRQQSLEITLFANAPKKLRADGVAIAKAKDFYGAFHAVLFCPEHLYLIQGAPATRRLFLDGAISQLRVSYAYSLSMYQQLLRQKNALLKSEKTEIQRKRTLCEILNQQMAPHAQRIAQARIKYLFAAEEYVCAFMRTLSADTEQIRMVYEREGIPCTQEQQCSAELFYQASMKNMEREFAARTCLSGVHRDDFAVYVNDRPARLYCSQGQDRSLALALKLAEGELSKRQSGEYPVFLFDDVLSELDKRRRGFLHEALAEKQVVMSCCESPAAMRAEYGTESSIWLVQNGTFLQTAHTE